MSTKDLTKDNPLKLILAFMLPIFAGNLFQLLYNFTDAVIVGRALGVEALGAVGVTTPLIFMVISFVFATTQGFSVVLAQKFGAEQFDLVKKSYASSILLSGILAVFITLLILPNTVLFLKFLNTPSEILDMANSYLSIIFGGLFATIFYNMLSNTIRALGDSKTPLYFLILSSVLNIVLDLLFVVKLNFSVAGAAWATVVSQIISGVLCLILMCLKFPVLKLNLNDWKLDWKFLYEHIRIGIPMGIQISILSMGKIILQYVLNGFGTNAIAAFTTGMRVDQIFYQIYLALGITMANYTAQNHGAGKISRIKKGAEISMRLVLLITIFSVVVLGFFADEIASLFMETSNQEVVELAALYLHIIMIFLFFLGTLLVFRNILQGIGEVGAPLLSGVVELIVRGGAAIFLGYYFNYTGICFATPLAWLAGALVLFGGYKLSLKRRLKKLKNK
ncbi:MAG: MATE family efflux transporter [Candidatus Gastranaerophilales bacterium]|nr:MATE family efflux transporter [Candidatus Gastranaerophilales bacterium]